MGKKKINKPPTSNHDKHAADLKSALDKSSESNRNLLIAFVGFLVYVLVAVGSTTDMMFISEVPLKLPLVGLDIPLFGFYGIIPLFVVGFHFDFLFNLREHFRKLTLWHTTIESEVSKSTNPRVLLFPYLFNFRRVHVRSFAERLENSAIWIVGLVLPLIVLSFIQRRFSSSHNVVMTVWHLIIFLADLALINAYWKRAINNTDEVEEQSAADSTGSRFFVRRFAALWRARTTVALAFFLGINVMNLVGLLLTKYSALPPRSAIISPEKFLTLLSDAGERTRVRTELDLGEISSFSALGWGAIWAFTPPLNLSEKDFGIRTADLAAIKGFEIAGRTQEEAYRALTKGADLRNLDLRFAYLRKSVFLSADLRGADLTSADLTEAQLEGANLEDAKLSGAILVRAKMQRASLKGARVRFADLRESQLKEALLSDITNERDDWPCHDGKPNPGNLARKNPDLRNADLTCSDLSNAQLPHADFSHSNLTQTTFYNADLQCSDFTATNLTKANLDYANLMGTNLLGAELIGTSTVFTDFRFFRNQKGEQIIKIHKTALDSVNGRGKPTGKPQCEIYCQPPGCEMLIYKGQETGCSHPTTLYRLSVEPTEITGGTLILEAALDDFDPRRIEDSYFLSATVSGCYLFRDRKIDLNQVPHGLPNHDGHTATDSRPFENFGKMEFRINTDSLKCLRKGLNEVAFSLTGNPPTPFAPSCARVSSREKEKRIPTTGWMVVQSSRLSLSVQVR